MKKTATLLLLTFCLSMGFSQETNQINPAEYTAILQDFSSGKPVEGNWILDSSMLSQTNTSVPCAKYILPLQQNNVNHLLQFTATSGIAAGKIGYGMHFLASEIRDPAGYGYGQSFLVWITRDEAHYQNSSTYVQLYRSFSDYRMVEIGSVAIAESINDELVCEVYVNTIHKIIFISINGDLKLFIPVKDFDFTGNSIAFRTMGGPVSFTKCVISKKD
ncbi:MAG: hypothetical protein JW904_04655 [Spirochaetales bacterium]|nr:hypothetical protein [Spirochaetales bacterium]